jgi:hypothetical protein
MLPLLMMLADVQAMMAKARALTAPERGCGSVRETGVTVCGRRAADRFRVPFTGYEPGDPRAQTVAGERQRLLNRTNACQDRRAIMVDCGFVGAHFTAGGRSGPRLSGRELAP